MTSVQDQLSPGAIVAMPSVGESGPGYRPDVLSTGCVLIRAGTSSRPDATMGPSAIQSFHGPSHRSEFLWDANRQNRGSSRSIQRITHLQVFRIPTAATNPDSAVQQVQQTT